MMNLNLKIVLLIFGLTLSITNAESAKTKKMN